MIMGGLESLNFPPWIELLVVWIIKFSSLDRVTGGLELLNFPPWIELLWWSV